MQHWRQAELPGYYFVTYHVAVITAKSTRHDAQGPLCGTAGGRGGQGSTLILSSDTCYCRRVVRLAEGRTTADAQRSPRLGLEDAQGIGEDAAGITRGMLVDVTNSEDGSKAV